MRADSFLALQVRDPRYGPCYVPGELAVGLLERYPKTVAQFASRVEFVAERLGGKRVADLERTATALYVRREMESASVAERADRITRLKPHISPSDATAAVDEVDQIAKDAESLFRP